MSHNIYSNSGDIVEIRVTDCTGRRLFSVKSNLLDESEVVNLFKTIVDKYGLGITIRLEQRERAETDDIKW